MICIGMLSRVYTSVVGQGYAPLSNLGGVSTSCVLTLNYVLASRTMFIQKWYDPTKVLAAFGRSLARYISTAKPKKKAPSYCLGKN